LLAQNRERAIFTKAFGFSHLDFKSWVKMRSAICSIGAFFSEWQTDTTSTAAVTRTAHAREFDIGTQKFRNKEGEGYAINDMFIERCMSELGGMPH
jgi:hypothetical protein